MEAAQRTQWQPRVDSVGEKYSRRVKDKGQHTQLLGLPRKAKGAAGKTTQRMKARGQLHLDGQMKEHEKQRRGTGARQNRRCEENAGTRRGLRTEEHKTCVSRKRDRRCGKESMSTGSSDKQFYLQGKEERGRSARRSEVDATAFWRQKTELEKKHEESAEVHRNERTPKRQRIEGTLSNVERRRRKEQVMTGTEQTTLGEETRGSGQGVRQHAKREETESEG
ncbi:hypothetical protein ERJ75_000655900 [Trypanosoma vivax]|nr:hypothetical protein ERJ75_000655900 [Trypanosoma vivax]